MRFVAYRAPAVLLTLIVGVQQRRPDLQSWHLVALDREFTASQATEITTLQDYLEMEVALFQQLDERVFAVVPVENQRRFLRFSRAVRQIPVIKSPIGIERSNALIPRPEVRRCCCTG